MVSMGNANRAAKPHIGVSRNVQVGILATDTVALSVAALIGFVTRFAVGAVDTGVIGPIRIVGGIGLNGVRPNP